MILILFPGAITGNTVHENTLFYLTRISDPTSRLNRPGSFTNQACSDPHTVNRGHPCLISSLVFDLGKDRNLLGCMDDRGNQD